MISLEGKNYIVERRVPWGRIEQEIVDYLNSINPKIPLYNPDLTEKGLLCLNLLQEQIQAVKRIADNNPLPEGWDWGPSFSFGEWMAVWGELSKASTEDWTTVSITQERKVVILPNRVDGEYPSLEVVEIVIRVWEEMQSLEAEFNNLLRERVFS